MVSASTTQPLQEESKLTPAVISLKRSSLPTNNHNNMKHMNEFGRQSVRKLKRMRPDNTDTEWIQRDNKRTQTGDYKRV